jgi:cell division protein FtsI/penicillin-binding protein 2
MDEPEAVRVLPRAIAELTRHTMRGVVKSLDRRMASIEGLDSTMKYELFGKSGTAEIPIGSPPKGKKLPKGADGYFQDQYNASFIAGGPADDPRLVVLVVIDDPGPAVIAKRQHYGSPAAGPVVRRIMERSLEYLGVPPKAQAASRVASAGRSASSDE